LGVVEVSVSDAWGNPANPGKSFEVSLKTAAVALDGSGRSAKVTARGSNRVRLCEGSAAFHDVKLKADAYGEFALTVTAKTRSLVSSFQAQAYHIFTRAWHCALMFRIELHLYSTYKQLSKLQHDQEPDLEDHEIESRNLVRNTFFKWALTNICTRFLVVLAGSGRRLCTCAA
jgi:hypothetical protein